MHNQLEHNKRSAEKFYDLFFNQGKPAEAIEQFAGDTYIQHNPTMVDGKQGFIDYFNIAAQRYPDRRVYLKRTLADGPYVIIHVHMVWQADFAMAGIDIFKFDDQGKIIEHWDVLQKIPDESANGNTMF